MTVWFVSRHAGAQQWAKRRAIDVDRYAEHLDPEHIETGDIVLGTLPLQIAARVIERGGEFYLLSMALPKEWRGKELSVEQIEALGAKLERFEVKRVESGSAISIQTERNAS